MFRSLAPGLCLCLLATAACADTLFTCGSSDNTVRSFNSTGVSLGSFSSDDVTPPVAVAVAANGDIYLANDAGSAVIEKFSPSGAPGGTFGAGALSRPYGLAFDSEGQLYAANFGDGTIRKFTATGTDLGVFASGLSGPVGLAFDASGNLYVAEYGANRVSKFAANGQSLGVFANTNLSVPYSIAFDPAGNLFVTNVGSNSVQKFSAVGGDLGTFATGFNTPTGITTDRSGNVFVISENSGVLEKYRADGTDLGAIGSAAGSAPAGLAISFSSGTIQFASATYNTNEAAGRATVTLERVGGNTGAVSVNYATADGTAIDGTDYTGVTGQVSWADSEAGNKTFTVPIIDRGLNTGDSVTVLLDIQPVGTVPVSRSQAMLSIVQTEPANALATLTSPIQGLVFVAGSKLSLTADIKDPSGALSSVQFFIDSEKIATIAPGGPYTFTATAPTNPGAHTVAVTAVSLSGETSTDSHVFSVRAAPQGGPNIPGASIITDVAGRNFAAGASVPLTIKRKPGAGDAALARLDLYADGQIFASFDGAGNPLTNSAPRGPVTRAADKPLPDGATFQAAVTMPGATKLVNILAVALDQVGRSGVSSPLTVQSVASVPDQPPTVGLQSPTPDGRVRAGAATNVIAFVSDPDAIESSASRGPVTRSTFSPSGVIAKVEYYLNQLKVKEAAEAPYTFAFTPPADGNYTLTAIATDGAGLATVSSPVNVTAFTAPVITLAPLGATSAFEGKKGKALFIRAGDLSGPLTVLYSIDGTATNGVDYVDKSTGAALSGSIVIPAGTNQVKLKIPFVEDGAFEGATEKIKLKLLPGAENEYDIGSPAKAVFKILDEDVAPPPL